APVKSAMPVPNPKAISLKAVRLFIIVSFSSPAFLSQSEIPAYAYRTSQTCLEFEPNGPQPRCYHLVTKCWAGESGHIAGSQPRHGSSRSHRYYQEVQYPHSAHEKGSHDSLHNELRDGVESRRPD